ncbi:MAG: peptidoglycan-binding protein [Rhodobacteraceae bacterium]|nr:peptidoglycan-binding protein [Paracoccaceae bacterium]
MTPARRLLAALWLALAAAQPAAAGENATCLQEQLATLGFNPGPADGKIGPATRNALAAYEAANAIVADRQLDAFSALVFCRELAGADKNLSRHWPSFGRRLRIEVAGTPDNDLRTDLLLEASKALTVVESLFGIQLAAPVDIVIGSNAAKISDRAAPLTETSAASVRRFTARLCQDAPDYGIASNHLPGVILFCHQPDATYNSGFTARDLRNQLGRVLAMEMITQLTGDPATGSDDEYLRRNGPTWLIVGTMQLLQREVDGVITPLGRKTSVEKLRTDGVTNPRHMEYYLSSLEDPAGIGRTGLLVTDDLTRETGLKPIGEFYRLLGTGLTVDDAFQRAFGKTLAEVYEGYP